MGWLFENMYSYSGSTQQLNHDNAHRCYYSFTSRSPDWHKHGLSPQTYRSGTHPCRRGSDIYDHIAALR